MSDPFKLLGVSYDADDEAVRRAWLEQVRRCPPDRDPERFKAIRAAYEQIGDLRGRLRYHLFDSAPPELSEQFDDWMGPVGSGRPSSDHFTEALASTLGYRRKRG